MSEPTRLLFVCLGNICRSPSGENLMRHVVESEGLSEHFEIDSAGTAGYHVGNPPDARMTAAAQKRGFTMRGRARQVKPADFENFDFIFAMDRANYEDLLDVRDRCEAPTAELRLFCTYCTEHDDEEVPDPYYGGPEGFEYVLDLLEDGCAEFLKQWRAKEIA